jgi:hypothetical protein
MIVTGERAVFFINADQIARVIDEGEDGVQVIYVGNPRPEVFNRQTGMDEVFIQNFLSQVGEDSRFTPLRRVPRGPTEYVNFNNARKVILEGQTKTATVSFPNGEQTYEGLDYDEISRRVSAMP